MDEKKSIELLKQQQELIPKLKQKSLKSPEFDEWRRNTRVIIKNIFDEKYASEFYTIQYSLMVYSSSTTKHDENNAYIRGLERANSLISSLISEIDTFGLKNKLPIKKEEPIRIVENICYKFHSIARQLQSRHSDRATLEIEDEYDVQDLLHALLKLHFDDIREEEYTPSYAGSSSRVDFLLKDENIIIEVKKTRKSLKAKEVGEQLIIDKAHYTSHPNCKSLICFVYDPDGKISNPVGLEKDLEKNNNGLNVKVIIAPK
ncbi:MULTISPECIES: hypothetical protein [unclassified Providencia]|uniref:PD-(D/E)XK nuclease domain-containing protein n=1 Tax=unclassified Providencia TaxID=2633465 RepID=UPI002349A2AA|nr:MULTISPECIES: hypothetical protein [unclassified Providencia]